MPRQFQEIGVESIPKETTNALGSNKLPPLERLHSAVVSLASQPLISIVILTYSEKRMNDLKELLESIDKQLYQSIEVVVVVERSEAISEFASGYKSKHPKKVYFTKEKLGVSKARNIGVDLSVGDIIAFVDDDAVLAADWSQSLLESFRNYPRAIGVTGKSIPLPKSAELHGFPKSLYWAIGCTRPGDTGLRYTNFASGVNMAFRRSAFSTHRFELNIIGHSRSRALVFKGLPNDENDFAVRLTTDLGQPILFNPGLIVLHKVYPERTNLRFIRQYAFWQGFAEARYRVDPKWKVARSNIYDNSIALLVSDVFSMEGGVKSSIRRLAFLLTSLFFVTMGFFAFNNRSVYHLGQFLL